MKRHGNLFDRMTSIQNIATAHAAAKRGKARYREVQAVDAAPQRHFQAIRDMLRFGRYRTAPYTCITRRCRCSGKVRVIHKLPYFPDRIVHHCIVQAIDPIWRKMMIRDTYACIPGRGIHDGMRRLRKALKDTEGTAYCLKMDVRQFYPTLDHDILKRLVRRTIKDLRLLAVIDEIIDSADQGVPIGNYLSQHFGNLYLTGYDHRMKEHHRCRYYFRYCDDVVVIGPDKGRLHALRESTDRYWADRLRLEMKGNWQVFPVDARGIDFLGYRFFHRYILLRKSIAGRYKRRLRAIRAGRQIPPTTLVGSVVSYEGWLAHADCRNLRNRYHDTIVDAAVAAVRAKLKEAA